MRVKIVLRRGLNKTNTYKYLNQFDIVGGCWMDFRWVNLIESGSEYDWLGPIIIGDSEEHVQSTKML